MGSKTILTATGAALASIAVFVFSGREAASFPMFERKLGLPCSTCHTTPPRLNETGYRFRAAGFRVPSTTGERKARGFNIDHYLSARLQARLEATRTQNGSTTTTERKARFQALELYPFTGPWGNWLSSNVKLTFTPDDPFAIENAHMKINLGNGKRLFVARAGIFHPFEGFGASDQPASISRPFFQTRPAAFEQPTFFTPWGFDQMGLEAGFDYGRTSIRAAILNGLELKEEDGNLTASAALPWGGSPGLPAPRSPDFQLFLNQILHHSGGSVSLHYYRGALFLPNSTSLFRNVFDRTAIYGSYPLSPHVLLLGGIQRGRDHALTGDRFSSLGYFVEAELPLYDITSAGIRFDWFDPARERPDNELRAITPYLNLWIRQQLRIVAEYQRRHTRQGTAMARRDDGFQVRFVYIR